MKKTKVAMKNADVAMIGGIQKYLPNAAFLVDGQSMPAAGVVTKLQTRVDAFNAVSTAEGAFHGSVNTCNATEQATAGFVTGIRQSVLAMFAGQPEVLAAFDVSPRKQPAPRTAEQKVVAAAKAKATRVARGTMGKKAKAQVKGTLTGPVVVPQGGSTSASNGSSSPASPPPAPPAVPATTNGTSTPHS